MKIERGVPERRAEYLETCFETFCKNGLENTSMQVLADACGTATANLVYYFGTKDNLIIEVTAHGMAKVEDDFMAQAPTSFRDIERFLREMPYLTAKLHGAKYRFMYQVYASPKYREHGKAFFSGVTPAPNTGNTARHFSAASMSATASMPSSSPPSWACRWSWYRA